MASVIDHYGDNQDVIIANAGPGHWNDPDMVRKFILRLGCLKNAKKIIPKKVKNSGYVGKIINKKSVIDHYGDNQDVIIANAGPGH